MINMEIVKYKPEYKNDFIRLSKNWITKYFALESDDFEVFENIDKLIKNGAMIYFAVQLKIRLNCRSRGLAIL